MLRRRDFHGNDFAHHSFGGNRGGADYDSGNNPFKEVTAMKIYVLKLPGILNTIAKAVLKVR